MLHDLNTCIHHASTVSPPADIIISPMHFRERRTVDAKYHNKREKEDQ
jgi:hypothetical protein